MKKSKRLSRRTVLRGLGTAIALPYLDIMRPSRAKAQDGPLRAIFVCFPNGTDMGSWTPSQEGAGYPLLYSLEPLAPVKSSVMLASGLDLDIPYISSPNTDHTAPNMMTCHMPRYANGGVDTGGPSIDRVIANGLNLPSTVIGHSAGSPAETDYSWDDATSYHPMETNPGTLFNDLFSDIGAGPQVPEQQNLRATYDKSILDFVMRDASRLQGMLGAHDKQQLEEYLESIRALERSIAQLPPDQPSTLTCEPGAAPPDPGYEQKVGVMYDILAKAMQCDQVRVATYGLDRELSGRDYNFLGSGFGDHHGLTHDDRGKTAEVTRWHVEQFSNFLQKLDSFTEGGGSVLDNSMILFGCQLSEMGGDHWQKDLPILLAGKGGGAINSGRHVRFSNSGPYYSTHSFNGTRLANMHLTIAQTMGLNISSFADSTGTVDLT